MQDRNPTPPLRRRSLSAAAAIRSDPTMERNRQRLIGGAFLAVTGGEAFYADMGHFGRFPIRAAWFGVALPALTLNYFGQGGLLLTEPSAIESPFYQLAPQWSHYAP